MKMKLALSCIFLSMSSSAFAGIDPGMLADVLNTAEAKTALRDQEIDSVKVVYNRQGRARFDYDIVVCGVSSNDKDETIFNKTAIYGGFAWFKKYSDGDIVQTKGKTEFPECK